jgi:hypothetical protein
MFANMKTFFIFVPMEVSFEMTKDELELFFKERPAISKTGICQEAEISKGLLDMILRGERPLTKDTVAKLKPVMKKYGHR